MDLIFRLADIENTAAEFVRLTRHHKVMAFYGEMGAGKTTFIHAVCNALGVTGTVSSPTFSIINQYSTADHETVFHLDLYRLRDEEEAIQAGVEDCLYSGGCCFVEWPEKAAGLFPANTLQVHIAAIDNETRKLTINL